jgi:hypothetical protein
MVLRDILAPIIGLTRQYDVRVALGLLEDISRSVLASQVMPFGRLAYKEVLRSFMRTEGMRMPTTSKITILNELGGNHTDEVVCNLDCRNQELGSDSSARPVATPKAGALEVQNIGIDFPGEVIRPPTSSPSGTPSFRREQRLKMKMSRQATATSVQDAVVTDKLAEVGQLEKKADSDFFGISDEKCPLAFMRAGLVQRMDERTFDFDELRLFASTFTSPQEEGRSSFNSPPTERTSNSPGNGSQSTDVNMAEVSDALLQPRSQRSMC